MGNTSRVDSRVGIGYDSHRFGPGDALILGGVRIPAVQALVGHSDADAICHAVTDALLGAAALGDIGALFPDTDPANKGRDSIAMLGAAVQRARDAGWIPGNVDITVICEEPKIGPHRNAIRARLAAAIGLDVDAVSVKGKTNEGMGWIGRNEGIAVIAVASVTRR
ncbi:MAG: 2-C-methyl-D-erythritol 2,4-cyclodiphosphate synthase [Gemmatimonadetes bacterium]|nr:2-C-methyl-D-erythritol 2,4-cyclodiphosphate synthase [Gemmatimonadota bacterium]